MHDERLKQTIGKPVLTNVPVEVIYAIEAIRNWAIENKYPDPTSWKGVDYEYYLNAAYRHLLHEVDDPHGIDKESGLPHIWHLACNVAFMCALGNTDPREARGHETK